MPFQLSPGVAVVEKDFSSIVPAVSSSVGAFAGMFQWGPVLDPVTIASENILVERFGKPNDTTAQSFFTAANFLSYANNMLVVRTDSTDYKNAVASGTPVKIKNFDDYQNLYSTGQGTVGEFAAKYPGTLGNSIAVSMADSTTFAAWAYKDEFDSAPSTSPYAEKSSADNDELHVVIIDDNGQWTGTAGAVLEKFAYVSKASDALNSNGSNNYYKDVINSQSKYVWWMDHTTSVTSSQTILTSVSVVAGGTRYLEVPTVSFTGGGGSNAAGTAVIGGGVVTGVTLDNAGSGYTSAPSAAIALPKRTIPTSGVTIATEQFTYATHGLVAGESVKYFHGGGTAAAGLSDNTEYFVSALGLATNTFRLATTSLAAAGRTALAGVAISGTGGQFTCTATTLAVGDHIVIGGTITGTGSITSHTAGKIYEVSAVTGTSPNVTGFTVTQEDGTAVVSTAGNGTGLTLTPYTIVMISGTGNNAQYFEIQATADQATATVNLNSSSVSWGTSTSAAAAGYKMLSSALTLPLAGGADGTSDAAQLQAGFAIFANDELYDISLIATGKVTAATAKYVVQNVAESRKDCVVFISPVDIATGDILYGSAGVTGAIGFRNGAAFNVDSSYAVLDSGYKYQYDRYNDKYRWIPLNGDIAGLCARTDYTNDPWFSPGGLNRGQVKNVVKLAVNPNKTERDNLYKAGVNPVVNFPGEGCVLFGDKTLQSKPSAFDRINVRRLFIVLEKAIATAAKYQLFEFNDSFTRAQFKNLVEPFLRDVQGRRGVTDFRVKCDEANNTGEVIDRNEFVADIFIKPNRSINFITLNFVAARSSVSFEEIGA